MTLVLWRKLFRDVRLTLLVVALFLGLFQVLWAKVTERVLGRLAPFFNTLADMGGLTPKDIESVLFEGTGKIVRTIIGGDRVVLDNDMDMLSIGYVHPLLQVLFCVWSIGRPAGAIAGEIDKGTMELLLAQPLARSRVIAAQLLLDLTTIPLLCLSLWAGNWIGAWLITPIHVEQPTFHPPPVKRDFVIELGPLITFRIPDPIQNRKLTPGVGDEQRLR